MDQPPTDRSAHDDGFTLLEVIVALGLLGIVATAAMTFLVRGLKDTSSIDQRQTAVTIAGQGMELVRAIAPAANTSGMSALVAGRAQSDVTTQWSSAVAVAGSSVTADMWPAYDSSATSPSSSPAIDLTKDVTVGGWTFHRSTLIGTCYRARGTTTSAPCGTSGTTQSTTPAAATSSGLVAMDRVVVLVSWTPLAGGSCASTSCSYSTTGLDDPNGDLTWNQDGTLKAVDDSGATVNAGSSVTINVLSNDVGTPSSTNPVTITQSPPASSGTAAVDSNGVVTFTAASGASSGTVTFQYTFTSSHGAVSNTATVTVTVNGTPTAGSYSVSVPASSASSPSAVDLGVLAHATNADSSSVVTIVAPQTSSAGDPGTLSASGPAAYLAPTRNTIGKRTFTYTITDNGMTSNTGTVQVSIVPVGHSYSVTAKKGSGTIALTVGTLEVPPLSAGVTQLTSYTDPSGCGSFSESGSTIYWTPPSTAMTCNLSYVLSGKASGTTDLSATSTLVLTVTSS